MWLSVRRPPGGSRLPKTNVLLPLPWLHLVYVLRATAPPLTGEILAAPREAGSDDSPLTVPNAAVSGERELTSL